MEVEDLMEMCLTR